MWMGIAQPRKGPVTMVYVVKKWTLLGLLGALALWGCNRSEPAPARQDNSPPAEAPATAPAAPPSAAPTAQAEGEAPMAFDSPPPVGTRARCPVMGNTFEVEAETERSEHDGKHYVFCCAGCKPRFDQSPAQFLTAAEGTNK
jgi:YHS domain-containing protein